MNIQNIDFYELCLDEGETYYADVYPLEKENFNQWMRDPPASASVPLVNILKSK